MQPTLSSPILPRATAVIVVVSKISASLHITGHQAVIPECGSTLFRLLGETVGPELGDAGSLQVVVLLLRTGFTFPPTLCWRSLRDVRILRGAKDRSWGCGFERMREGGNCVGIY